MLSAASGLKDVPNDLILAMSTSLRMVSEHPRNHTMNLFIKHALPVIFQIWELYLYVPTL